MTVNPINVNSQGIGNSYGYGVKPKTEEKETQEAPVAAGSEKKPVSANDVLSFMAQSAVSVTPATTKTIDPSKYVDKESEARIAGFMGQFEDIVAANLSAISAEFPEMSEGAKQSLALAQVKA